MLSHPADTIARMTHPDDVVYSHADRPVCEVQPVLDGPWYPGEVRALFRQDDGSWRINANWTVQHQTTYSRTLPSAQVRKPLDDGEYWAG